MSENEKICPLLTTNTVDVKIGTQPVICIREECAWWIEDKQKCAIAALGSVRR